MSGRRECVRMKLFTIGAPSMLRLTRRAWRSCCQTFSCARRERKHRGGILAEYIELDERPEFLPATSRCFVATSRCFVCGIPATSRCFVVSKSAYVSIRQHTSAYVKLINQDDPVCVYVCVCVCVRERERERECVCV